MGRCLRTTSGLARLVHARARFRARSARSAISVIVCSRWPACQLMLGENVANLLGRDNGIISCTAVPGGPATSLGVCLESIAARWPFFLARDDAKSLSAFSNTFEHAAARAQVRHQSEFSRVRWLTTSHPWQRRRLRRGVYSNQHPKTSASLCIQFATSYFRRGDGRRRAGRANRQRAGVILMHRAVFGISKTGIASLANTTPSTSTISTVPTATLTELNTGNTEALEPLANAMAAACTGLAISTKLADGWMARPTPECRSP